MAASLLHAMLILALTGIAFQGCSGRNNHIEELIESQGAILAEAARVFEADFAEWSEAYVHSNYTLTTFGKRYLINAMTAYFGTFAVARDRLYSSLEIEIEKKVAPKERDSVNDEFNKLLNDVTAKTAATTTYVENLETLTHRDPRQLTSRFISGFTKLSAERFEMITQVVLTVSKDIKTRFEKTS